MENLEGGNFGVGKFGVGNLEGGKFGVGKFGVEVQRTRRIYRAGSVES